jgi:hypothetical protein
MGAGCKPATMVDGRLIFGARIIFSLTAQYLIGSFDLSFNVAVYA